MPGIQALSLFSLLLIPLLTANAISGLLMQRAVLHVIKIFREHNAIGVNNARTVKDLGLTDEKNLPPREFRALRMLVQGGIIRTGQKETLYMPEEKFANFKSFLER